MYDDEKILNSIQLDNVRREEERIDYAKTVSDALPTTGKYYDRLATVGAYLENERAYSRASTIFKRGAGWRMANGNWANWDKTRKTITRGMRAARASANRVLAGSERFGRRLGVVGLGLSVANTITNPSVGNVVGTAIAWAAVYGGPVGLLVSTSYFIADIAIDAATEMSIGEHIDAAINKYARFEPSDY